MGSIELWDAFGSMSGWAIGKAGIWDIQGQAEERGGQGAVPIIAHKGEMLLPSQLADQIRVASGVGGTGTKGDAASSALLSGSARSFASIMMPGIALLAQGKISVSDVMSATPRL